MMVWLWLTRVTDLLTYQGTPRNIYGVNRWNIILPLFSSWIFLILPTVWYPALPAIFNWDSGSENINKSVSNSHTIISFRTFLIFHSDKEIPESDMQICNWCCKKYRVSYLSLPIYFTIYLLNHGQKLFVMILQASALSISAWNSHLHK